MGFNNMTKKEYYKKYRDDNREHINRYQRHWRQKNKEKVKKYNNDYWDRKEKQNNE